MLGLLAAFTLIATPGPASVLVLGNQSIAKSQQLARTYQRSRDIPDTQICLVQTSSSSDVSMDAFTVSVLPQVRECIRKGNLEDRIDTFAIVKGMPLRIQWSVEGVRRTVSFAAALMIADSTYLDGRPFLGTAPGVTRNCGGTPCYGARWSNPFREAKFGPGWNKIVGDVHWRLRLATMINGRTFADAARLISSATTAEARPMTVGKFLFMNGGDRARSSMDFQYDAVIDELSQRGFVGIERVAYDPNRTGERLASFLVGTLSLESTIEGNDFIPGSLVDNLTSYGAVPQNFFEAGEVQVSVARWIAKGVGGVHGTTAEPLADSFPDRRFLIDYVDGMTLSQAFYRRMPFVYWQNLVLGDPLLAPYARRPSVVISGVEHGETLRGARQIRIQAFDEEHRGIQSLTVYVNGKKWRESAGDLIEGCLSLATTESAQVLAVAQIGGFGDLYDQYLPKGWSSKTVFISPGPSDCSTTEVDAGILADTGETQRAESSPSDGGPNETSTPLPVTSECSCRVDQYPNSSLRSVWLFLLLLLRRRTLR
ncbi:MAG: TIGR03790 family protein [Myxococcota bacterium]|nr:TIGR03790 family protein [Myxococcota bacterium]